MVPRWPVAAHWRRLGAVGAGALSCALLLQGSTIPSGTIPNSLAAAAPPPPPEVGIERPSPFVGDGLNHVLAVIPSATSDGGAGGAGAPAGKPPAPRRADGGGITLDELAALTAAGTIAAFETGPDGRMIARYDDGRRATVRDGAVVWLDADEPAPTATAPTAPATTAPTTTAPTAPAADGLPAVLAPFAARADVRSVDDLGGGIWRFNGTFDPDELTAALASAGIAAEEDHIAQVAASDPYWPYQWNLENAGPGAHLGSGYVADADIDHESLPAAADGSGTVVAVIDSGANMTVADLTGRAWRNPGEVCGNGIDDDGNGYPDDCNGWNTAFGSNQLWAPSFSGHGTSVASIIAATSGNGIGIAGVAPGAQIMNLAAMPAGSGYESDVIEAMNYAIDNGADVINMSLGRSGGSCGAAYQWALARATANDVVVVVAAGNSNHDMAVTPSFPAACEGPLLSVGASAGDDTRSPFSNWGTSLVDLAAPGSATPMLSGTGSVVLGNGTSMAAPHVAATAALVLEQHPDWGVEAVRTRVLATVDVRAALVGTSVTGGRLNAAAAAADPPAPTTTAPSTTTTRPPVPDNPWDIRFAGFGHPGSAVEGTISVSGADPALFSAGVQWRLTVLTVVAGETYGVMGLPLSIDGAAVRTGADSAAVVLGEQTGSFSTNLATWLPPGRYAFVVEATVPANPARGYGRPMAVIVDVDGSSATTVTTTPNTTAPSPSTTFAPTSTTGPSSPTTSPTPTPTTGPSSPTTRTATPTSAPSSPTTVPIGGGGGSGGGGGGGGAPVTTTPWAPTTSPAVTPTVAPTIVPTIVPTTVVPTTTPSAPWRPDPVTPIVVGGWALSAIEPNWVAVDDAAAVIEIHGTFPQVLSYVFVGNQQATVLHAGPSLLRIRPPASSAAGVRSLTISWGGAVRLNVANGLWYLDPDGVTAPTAPPLPTTSSPPPQPPAPTVTTTPTTLITPGPPSATTTTATPAPTSTIPTSTTIAASTTTLPAGLLRSTPIFANSSQLRGGLTIRKVIGNNPLRDVMGELDDRACSDVDCAAFTL